MKLVLNKDELKELAEKHVQELGFKGPLSTEYDEVLHEVVIEIGEKSKSRKKPALKKDEEKKAEEKAKSINALKDASSSIGEKSKSEDPEPQPDRTNAWDKSEK